MPKQNSTIIRKNKLFHNMLKVFFFCFFIFLITTSPNYLARPD